MITKPSKGYGLLDSGREEKLERFGDFVLVRPDPQALWERSDIQAWAQADAVYVREGKEGEWKIKKSLPAGGWNIKFGSLQFSIKPTSFKHTGLFPEQLSNWDWVREVVSQKSFAPSILNLFGYTGGATLAAAQAGAQVTHVDASKSAVAWAKENAELSGLGDKPIRWMIDDVLAFVKREVKRGATYDAIIMDPPAFGHGPKNELWKIEEHLLELIPLCSQLLSDKPLFILINGYAAGYSPLAFAYNLQQFEKKYGGMLEYGDLTIAESKSQQGSEPRLLPCGIFARWKSQ